MRTRTVITPAGGVSPGGGPRHRRPGNGAEIAGTGITESLVIASRFCGPTGSGNGGYVCGRIAAYADGPVTVTLRQPPALATEGTS